MLASIYIHFIQCTLVGAEGSTIADNDSTLFALPDSKKGASFSRDNIADHGGRTEGVGRFHWSVSMVPLSLAKKWRSRHRKAFTIRPRWLDDLPPFSPSFAPFHHNKGQPPPLVRPWAFHSELSPYSSKEKPEPAAEGRFFHVYDCFLVNKLQVSYTDFASHTHIHGQLRQHILAANGGLDEGEDEDNEFLSADFYIRKLQGLLCSNVPCNTMAILRTLSECLDLNAPALLSLKVLCLASSARCNALSRLSIFI